MHKILLTYAEKTTGRVFLSPILVHVDDQVMITCRADRKVDWTHNKGPLPEGVWSFKDGKLPMRLYNLTTDANTKVLVIQQAQKKHSGIFTCNGEDSEISHFTEDVQLSVMGKCLMCPWDILKKYVCKDNLAYNK